MVTERDTLVDERGSGVLAPDTLLASQYFDRVRGRAGRDGERRLMVAVLEDAVLTYLKHARAGNPEASELFREAESWIESPDSTWFFSFENICAVLDLDPGYLRRGLRAWKTRAHVPSTAEAGRQDRPDNRPDERRRASGE